MPERGYKVRVVGSSSVGIPPMSPHPESGGRHPALHAPPRPSRHAVVAALLATLLVGFAHDEALGIPPGVSIVGPGLPGMAGVPSIDVVGAFVPGRRVTVHLRGARPLAYAHLVIGFRRIDAPFHKGGTFYPAPHVMIVRMRTGLGGQAKQTFTYPHGMPPGTQVVLQYWVEDPWREDGWSATPGVQIVTP